MARGDAKRKIFFYRLLREDNLKPLSREAVCKRIESFTGEDVYHDDGDMVTRAEVYSKAKPQSIRFFKVRYDQLPGVDTGDGKHRDLALASKEGLGEPIHIRLYPNGVLAAESFGFGPRATRFATYVNEKLGLPCVLNIEVRHDVVDEALKFGDIRLLKIKMEASRASQAAASHPSMNGLMNTSVDLGAGLYAELIVRSEGGDGKFTDKVKGLITDLFSDGAPDGAIERVEVEGKPNPDTPVAALDLLSQHLYRVEEIALANPRTRELDAAAAFTAIQKAYDNVKQDLPKDATAG